MIKKAAISNRIFIFILFLLAGTFFSFAQLYNFKKYTTKNGLGNSTLNSIIQSDDGYLWFGTQGGGLCRFDGKDFKIYTKYEGLLSNDITSIIEDKNHNLWVGTVEGLCFFDGVSFKAFPGKDGVEKTCIYNLYEDNYGDIWIPTRNLGLKIYRNGKFITVDTTNGLTSNGIFAVTQDKNNNYWVATYKGGLYKMNREGKILKHVTELDGVENTSVFCMLRRGDSVIYLGSNTSGLYKLRMSDDKITKVRIPELENEFIGSIIADSHRNLWVSSEHGLVKFSEDGYKVYREYDGLSSEVINTLCEDYEGNIWIGTLGGGACLLKREAIVSYTSRDGLSNNKIANIFRTSDGSLFVSSMHAGLNYYNPETKRFEVIKVDPVLDNNNVSAYCQLPGNRIMIGMEENGLVLLEQSGRNVKLIKKIQTYKRDGVEDILNYVSGIAAHKNGSVYVGTYGHGIFKLDYDGNILDSYSASEENGLKSNDISTIRLDERGRLIVGVFTAGLMVLGEDGKFVPLSKDAPEQLNTTWTTAIDNNGALFFGTQDGGIVIYHNGKFINYNISSGLCSNFIQAMAMDNKTNSIWIGTDKGVNRIRLNKDYTIAEIRFYGTEDGFLSAEVVPNSAICTPNGEVWFGTAEGLTRYTEKFDYPNNVPPKLVLSEIRLFYDHVDWKQYTDKISQKANIPIELTLPYNKNHLTFNFRALTVDNVKYRFILEGLDEEWSPYSSNNEAVYTNIPPGTYTFRMSAKNSSGIESSEVVQFTFSIRPPFWKTWWFYTITVIVVLAGLFLFFRWRTANLEKEKRILEHKVNERTAELKTANEHLSVALHDIKDSINYAERIQRAIMPVQDKIRQSLPQSFILFRPRDVVSGDFYWYNHKDGIDYIAAVDCTGHGVPGAFMSMVGSSLLNEIVLTKGISDPSQVLTQLNAGVQNALKQKENQTRDGMDLAFCAIDYTNRKLFYAGANRSLWIIRNTGDAAAVEEIKATKCAIGGFTNESQVYDKHEVQLNAGDTIYMHSDGFADQFGGPQGKKLMTKRFKDILLSIQNFGMGQQATQLGIEIDEWMGSNYEQVDDILVIGVKF